MTTLLRLLCLYIYLFVCVSDKPPQLQDFSVASRDVVPLSSFAFNYNRVAKKKKRKNKSVRWRRFSLFNRTLLSPLSTVETLCLPQMGSPLPLRAATAQSVTPPTCLAGTLSERTTSLSWLRRSWSTGSLTCSEQASDPFIHLITYTVITTKLLYSAFK